MSQARLAVIQQVYAAWEAEQGNVQPDPQFARSGPSQYPEGIVAVSAPTPAQDDLYGRVREALKRAGLS